MLDHNFNDFEKVFYAINLIADFCVKMKMLTRPFTSLKLYLLYLHSVSYSIFPQFLLWDPPRSFKVSKLCQVYPIWGGRRES